MVEVAVVEDKVRYGVVRRPAAKVKEASSTTPPADSKRMRPALYAPRVSARPRKVLLPRPKEEVAVKRYPPIPSPTRNWFRAGAVEVPVPPWDTARTPVTVLRLMPRVEVEVVAQVLPFQYRRSPKAEPRTWGMEVEAVIYAATVVEAREVVKKRFDPSVRSFVLIWIEEVAMFVQVLPFQYRRFPSASVIAATSCKSSILLSARLSAVRAVCRDSQ
jgi:hypothetical protein